LRRDKDEKRGQAAERAKQEAKAAQKRVPVPTFETKDAEVAAQLSAAYRPQFVRSKRAKDASGQIVFSIEDPERRGPGVAAEVAAKREELAAQRMNPDAFEAVVTIAQQKGALG
jgi:hypothetical protein